jgi:hypothetical protein
MIILGMTRIYYKVVDRLQNKCNAFMSTGEMVDENNGN